MLKRLQRVAGMACVVMVTAGTATANTWYVSTNSISDGPGDGWDTAFHTIQKAVNVASSNDTVLVGDGMYVFGTKPIPGYASLCRVVITNDITVRSVNGPGVTTIQGVKPASGGTGADAVRGVYMTAGVLSGFTITNGHTMASGDYTHDQCGGGVYLRDGDGVISNCVIVGCSAFQVGGGGYYATLENCIVIANSAYRGGGCEGCTLYSCNVISNSATRGGGCADGTLYDSVLIGNTADDMGGGFTQCHLYDCTLVGNSAKLGGACYVGELNNCSISNNYATEQGGGCYEATLNGCVLVSNISSQIGGGCYLGELNNCLLVGNSAMNGGGSYDATLQNCTVTGNRAFNSGGGCYDGTLANCIVYYNTAVTSDNNQVSCDMSYCCTAPTASGAGNITGDPLFMSGRDFHLQVGSACIDAGTNLADVVDDLDGVSRPLDGDKDGVSIMDMGCYEVMNRTADSDGDAIPDGWEADHQLNPSDSSDQSANPDNDPLDNMQEYICDTDPQNSNDYFCITAVSNPPTGSGQAVFFYSSSNRIYTLLGCTNLKDNVWQNIPGATDIRGTGGVTVLQDTNQPPYGPFYKLKVGLKN